MRLSHVNRYLELAIQEYGSDLHLVAGQAPRIRVHGNLHRVRCDPLEEDELTGMIDEIMTEEQRAELAQWHNLDFAYEVDGLGRFRVAAHHHLGGPAAVFRIIPGMITPLHKLDLPPSVAATVSIPNGLTVVTGPTGCGKSTTLAGIIDYINSTRRGHILTIEDPIEFVHEFKGCVVTQREVGKHAPNFAEALRNALREDPDVILIGELRDRESISLALTAAETGIQVLATLHTSGAMRTVDRMVNVFPAARQSLVRSMLSESLRMVVSQQLVPNRQGDGRLMCAEVMISTHAVSSIIRSGKVHHLRSVIQSSAKEGMQTLDGQLTRRMNAGEITGEAAHRVAVDKSKFQSFVSRHSA